MFSINLAHILYSTLLYRLKFHKIILKILLHDDNSLFRFGADHVYKFKRNDSIMIIINLLFLYVFNAMLY